MGFKEFKDVQFGESVTGDLTEGTWTFEVENLSLKAGVFAIIKKEDYSNLISQRNKLLEVLQEAVIGYEWNKESYPDIWNKADDEHYDKCIKAIESFKL